MREVITREELEYRLNRYYNRLSVLSWIDPLSEEIEDLRMKIDELKDILITMRKLHIDYIIIYDERRKAIKVEEKSWCYIPDRSP